MKNQSNLTTRGNNKHKQGSNNHTITIWRINQTSLQEKEIKSQISSRKGRNTLYIKG